MQQAGGAFAAGRAPAGVMRPGMGAPMIPHVSPAPLEPLPLAAPGPSARGLLVPGLPPPFPLGVGCARGAGRR